MNALEYNRLSLFGKFGHNLKSLIIGIFGGIFAFIKSIPVGFVFVCGKIGSIVLNLGRMLVKGDIRTKLSFIFMGFGNIFRGQVIKGLIFLGIEAGFFYYMFLSNGLKNLLGLRTLGTVQRGWVFDEELGIDVMNETGDNSMLILLYGVLTIFIIVAFICVWYANLQSSYDAQTRKSKGKKLPTFIQEMKTFADHNFHKTLLFIPIIGILTFTVVPLVYMIAIAFTNYDRNHQVPANLFDWVGFANFKTMLGTDSQLSDTFWPILGWTLVWAFFATFLNYIFGIIIALLINKKGIKCKALFRTLFVLAIAVPQFVSLLVMRNVLADMGPLNVLLQELGFISDKIPFLTETTFARVSVIVVNLWIGIPYTMLITSGILMNIPADLYEAGLIDGASPVKMFTKITMPYILFVTTPYLITQFIGNINNFNLIFFLTGGTPATLDYYQAGTTDLLVTWLYKLTVNSRDYCYAATIGIIVFIISAIFSLITFRNSNSYKNEEAFQ